MANFFCREKLADEICKDTKLILTERFIFPIPSHISIVHDTVPAVNGMSENQKFWCDNRIDFHIVRFYNNLNNGTEYQNSLLPYQTPMKEGNLIMEKRLTAALFLASVLLGTAACGNTEGTVPSETDPTQTTVEETSDLDAFTADYGGYEFRIATTNKDANTWFTTPWVIMEDTGDVFSAAVYQRNTLVEGKLNIHLKEIPMDISTFNTAVQAGEDFADMALIGGNEVSSALNNKSLCDLFSLPYQDFSKRWWDSNAAAQLSIDGKLCFGTGDFDTTAKDMNCVTYFNKRMIEAYDLEDPYALVDSGKWTLDKMVEMGMAVMQDNGDSKWDDNDTFGLLGHQNMLYIYLICGSGESIVTKDKNDIPAFTFNSEKFTNAYLKVLHLIHDHGEGFLYDANVRQNTRGLSNNHRVMEIMFPADQALFWVEGITWAKALREMDAEFGVVPCPKYDEKQEGYYSMNNGSYYGMTIPVTAADTDRSSFILEALNAYSADTVAVAYYDLYLKGKGTRDEDSARMLDVIFGNVIYDPSIVYFIGRIRHNICGLALNNDTGIQSYYETQVNVLNDLVNDIIEANK